MIVFYLNVFVLVLLLLNCVVRVLRRPKNYPPGPMWWPIVGNFLQLKSLSKQTGGQHKAFKKLSEEYNSDIMGLKIGKDLAVVVHSFDLAKEVLTREVFEGRPDNVFFRIRCMGKRRGISSTDGPLWHTQRNFLIRHLRNLGFGKSSMETMIQTEIATIMSILKSEGSEIQMGKFLAPAILNILCVMITGSRVTDKNSKLYNLLDLLNKRGKAFDMLGGSISIHPWLRYVFPEKSGFNLVLRMNYELKEIFLQSIQKHYENWSEGDESDLIYAFISEMKKNNNNNKKETSFTEHQLIMVCLDLFIAGSETTSNTLDFAIMMMILHPEIQEKIQAQMDQIFDKDAIINYSDRKRLPYIEAVLLEVQRLHYVIPVSGIRRTLRNTTLGGYDIPKDATVYINQYAINHSDKYWENPEAFQPERFLDDDGLLKQNNEVLFPFGMGRRKCIGEMLAKKSIFLIFTSILKKYKVSLRPGSEIPTGDGVLGISLSPDQYRVRFTERY